MPAAILINLVRELLPMSIDAFSMDFFSLKGKTAIVTGGNTGLGMAFATALAKAGADLFIPSYIRDDGDAGKLIEKQGVSVAFMAVDITEAGAPKRIIEAYHHGRIFILSSVPFDSTVVRIILKR